MVTEEKRVPLAEVLTLDRDEIVVDRSVTYEVAGVRSFGRGLFAREALNGATTSYGRLYRLRVGQVVFSRLFGWEGAVALVTPEFDGWVVSPEFPTLTPNPHRLDASYIGHYVRWPRFHEELAGVTRGLGQRRKRVHVEDLLRAEIYLPPLQEQLAISARLQRVNEISHEVIDRAKREATLTAATSNSLVESLFAAGIAAGWPSRHLAEVACVNPRPERLGLDEPVAFVPMAAVDAATGAVMNPATRPAGEIGAGYKQFAVGDVIFARITPCMQNGKCAVFDGPHAYGYGSTEFHVVRAGPEVKASWLHRVMRSVGFRQQAAERFKGTAGQQRVPADFLKTVRIPVPPLTEQDAAVRELDRIAVYGARLAAARARANELVASLEASVMNREFRGLN